MSIGSKTLNGLMVVLALSLAGGCETAAQQQPATAWWVDMRFEPAASTVRGMAVSTIDADWRAAETLDRASLAGRITDGELQAFDALPVAFGLTLDLDQDGATEELFVGIYAAVDGSQGRFAAITRNGQYVAHFVHAGTPGFSVLAATPDGVRWYKCLECGDFDAIVASGGSFFLE